ncbi:hypothetical protein LX97_03155 [Nonlabens dokdonensis]|jgi:hypothetical protein|uniref:Uncharacterized protein n=2 Tax=Nonlabens dokdonensis TaxID=328515 RepID=L7WGK5_NONDD|nr:hypothetical protein [Nonlabens dokdonensis]AGC78068.1 hypothetical protein DDD_2941 [Nonlabens dokdonensis DSW-6]PZX37133.1 hypothetical protein LX97_03155 [Nonlabens dokdonensis]
MKKTVVLIILCLTFQYSFGQNKNDFYTSFSESGIKHNLNFDKNNIVRISSIRRHMSPFYNLVGTYKKRGDSIYIKIQKINSLEVSKAKKFGFESFSEMELVLYANGSELIDPKNRTVYVTSRKLNRKKIKRQSIAFIDNKKYIYERLVTDGYGLIRREPRKNKSFDKALAEVLKNPDNYERTIIRGLTAYEKYGLIGINGVSIINKKN